MAAAVTAVVLAGAAGLAVFATQAQPGAPELPARHVTQVHAFGRGLLAGTGSYTQSAVASTSQAAGFASGRGGAMEYAGLELSTAKAPDLSRQRGGTPETVEVR